MSRVAPDTRDRGDAGDDAAEEIELVGLLEALERRWGIDLRGWAAAPVRARLQARMRARRLRSLSEVQGWLLRDRAAFQALVGELWRRPAGGMFADPLFWRGLRREVIPALRSWPLVRVWVAGCGDGEDAWSMAVLLAEEGLGARARVQATDPDEAALVRAARGALTPAQLEAWEARHRQAGGDGLGRFVVAAPGDGTGMRVAPEVLERIAWARHLPGVDGAFNEFSLILFRNPFVWTGTAERRRVAELLRQSQARFGFLCVDEPATLGALDGWDVVDRALGIARRVG